MYNNQNHELSQHCLSQRKIDMESSLVLYTVDVSEIVPKEKVFEKAVTIAREIAENTSAVSVALSKALLWHGLVEDDPQSVHLVDSRCFFWSGLQKDAFEGVQSFLDKRPPNFTMKVSQDMPEFYPWWKEPEV